MKAAVSISLLWAWMYRRGLRDGLHSVLLHLRRAYQSWRADREDRQWDSASIQIGMRVAQGESAEGSE